MLFETWLVRKGVITADDFVRAVELQTTKRPRFGELALKLHKLSMKQVFHILEEQANSVEAFGEIAVRLKYLKKQQVAHLLLHQASMTPPIAACLLELGVLDEQQLGDALRCFHANTYANACDLPEPDCCPLSLVSD